MPYLGVEQFDLFHTLHSGQLFRFWNQDDWWWIAHQDQFFKIRQQKNRLSFQGTKRSTINSFFRLDEDHAQTRWAIRKDASIEQALLSCPGLRIMRQDPWECSMAFILSSNSNIKRIQGCMNKFAYSFGDPIELEGRIAFSFPTHQEFTKEELRGLRAGYRTKYLADASRILTPVFFDILKELPYAEARKTLCAVSGIGPKVADCILLFSLGRLDAFPVDVWIRKILQQTYKTGKTTDQKLSVFGRNYFGPLAGYAQQYLYHWGRIQAGKVSVVE